MLSNIAKETIFESRINKAYRILWKYEDGKVILLLLVGDHKSVEGKK
jgi:vancomycin permeability regulator SanA